MVRGLLVMVLLTGVVVSVLTMQGAGNKGVVTPSINSKGEIVTTVSKRGGYLGAMASASNLQATQSLNTAFQTASQDAITNNGQFAVGKALATSIHDGEPGITVVVGGPAAVSKAPPTTVAIAPDSSATKIHLFAHSSAGGTFELRGAVNQQAQVNQIS
jgi:hypothetical protein